MATAAADAKSATTSQKSQETDGEVRMISKISRIENKMIRGMLIENYKRRRQVFITDWQW